MADWLTGTVDFFAKIVTLDAAAQQGPATSRTSFGDSASDDPPGEEFPVNSVGTELHRAVWTCQADAAMREHLGSTDQELRAAFGRADANADGVLSHDEWVEAFGHVVEDTSCKSMLMRLFEDIDADKNGLIDTEEFVAGLHRIPTAAERIRSLLAGDPALVNRLDEEGQSPAYVAAARGDTETLRALLAADADVNLSGTHGEGAFRTPLHAACRCGRASSVRMLMESKADASIGDECGVTPLFVALEARQVACVQALLLHGADANARLGTSGDSALAMAAYYGLHKAIPLFVQHGGDPHSVDASGRNAMFAAALSREPACVEALLVRVHVRAGRVCVRAPVCVRQCGSTCGRTLRLERLAQKHKVDVQLEDEEGETALSVCRDAVSCCAEPGISKCLDLLVQVAECYVCVCVCVCVWVHLLLCERSCDRMIV